MKKIEKCNICFEDHETRECGMNNDRESETERRDDSVQRVDGRMEADLEHAKKALQLSYSNPDDYYTHYWRDEVTRLEKAIAREDNGKRIHA